MSGSKTNEAGLTDDFMIDGDTYEVPKQYQPAYPLAQSVFSSMAGTAQITGAYRGDGLPDRPDSFSFALPYDINDTNGLTGEKVEILRATPGPHLFADFKQRPYFYSLRSGQNFLYLPREDAFGKWAIGSTAEMILNGSAIATVLYKASVASGDAVPNGECWISKALVRHPKSGRWVAPFKFAPAPGAAATLLVKYFPVFRVDVVEVRTDFGMRMAGQEDKVIQFIEVN